MGCKCNKRKLIEKISDDPIDKNLKVTGFKKILEITGTIVLKIFTVLLFIVVTIPIILYAIYCMFANKQPTINLKKIAGFKEEKDVKKNIKTKKNITNIKKNKDTQNRDNSWWNNRAKDKSI